MLEKKILNQEFIRWKGKIPVEYLYTTGIAGEQFFRILKEKGRIMGTACTKCRLVYLPPRMFCERCFSRLNRWKTVPQRGSVFTYTINHFDADDNHMQAPIIVALIKFKGFHGGIIHKLGEVLPEEVTIGMAVIPVFKNVKERTGSINDIKYFKPI